MRELHIAALGLGVAFGFSLEVSAGHIVEQELEVHSEPTLVTLQQVLAERILVRYEYVQAPIQAVVVNLLPVQPEQVSQSAVLIPALSHLQFTFVATKPCDGGKRPVEFLSISIDMDRFL